MSGNDQIGFFTAVSYGDCNQKYDSLREALDHYFFWGDHKAVVISGSQVLNGVYSVELKEIPPNKLNLCRVLIKIVQILSYIPFGLPALLIKWALRPKFVLVSPDPNPKRDTAVPQASVSASAIHINSLPPVGPPQVFPEGVKITTDSLPFDTPFQITSNQILQLRILFWGEVDNDETFRDSRIESKPTDDTYKNYIITRRRFQANKVELPILGGNQSSIPFESYSLSSDRELTSKNIPMYALDQVPKVLGRGYMSQVYATEGSQKEAAVFKLRNRDAGAREAQAFYPSRLRDQENDRYICFIDARSKQDMDESFHAAISVAKELGKLPKSPHIPKCYGIVYIKELNLWGPLYERIEGEHLPKYFDTIKKVKKVMKGVALGLQILDRHGHAYTDLKRSNIMVRKSDGNPVIVDDPAHGESGNWPALSQLSRQKFGTLLYNAIQGENSPYFDDAYNLKIPSKEQIDQYQAKIARQKDKSLDQLACDCWSDKTIEEFGWDHILTALS